MHTPIGKLKRKLHEYQLNLKKTFTVEELSEMKQALHEIRMTFAAYEEWDLYQRATDMITILLFQHALQQNHY
ncbi:hypothetical protein [Bacillus zhangzhouensis]|uniref:hypothetical protein n=1 Tax=Bacillus zhangzhouensis TaxID=1178540 RepID=UPI000554F937|nr:hypothetical protein [Bacillus zhangzhouensis]MDR0124231.1 hypothetical protein [Bacillus zhangzhouensis]